MTIISTLAHGVLTLKLNRPQKFNSFNREMALALQAALHEAGLDIAVRAIVLTGEGKAFCAGQDLEEVVSPDGPPLPTIVKEHYNKIILAIRNLEKPVIAAVNGVAAGAGANIALACDVIIAKKSASFIQAFSKIGLIPDSAGTFFLPRIIGAQKAMALMLTGDKVSAEEAEKMNMIYKAIDDETFDAEIMDFALKVAQMPTYGLGLTKRALNQSFTNNLEQQLELEGELQTKAGNSYDFKEGVTAFLEKRAPKFEGK
jgi:2-(1,2-epoxy-1,2-dihydrophenyl)acetyl-CoA isomerase